MKIYFLLFSCVWSLSSHASLEKFSPYFYTFIKKSLNVTTPSSTDFIDTDVINNQDYLGNGGDAILCEKKAILLDIYEGRRKYTYKYFDSMTMEEIAKVFIERIKIIDRHRAVDYAQDNLKTRYEKFIDDTEFSDDALINLPDSSIATRPRDCTIEQLAIQYRDIQADGKRYIVDKIIWDKLDELSKAALLAHEFFAREYFANGHRQTFFVRKLVGYLFSDQFADISEQMKFKNDSSINLKAGMMIYYYHRLFSNHDFFGARVTINKDSFNKDDSISFYVLDDYEYLGYDAKGLQYVLSLSGRREQIFFPNGQPKYLTADVIKVEIWSLHNYSMFFYAEEIELSFDNNLRWMIEKPSYMGNFGYSIVNPDQYRKDLTTLTPSLRDSYEEQKPRTRFVDNLPERLYFPYKDLEVNIADYRHCVLDLCDDLFDVVIN